MPAFLKTRNPAEFGGTRRYRVKFGAKLFGKCTMCPCQPLAGPRGGGRACAQRCCQRMTKPRAVLSLRLRFGRPQPHSSAGHGCTICPSFCVTARGIGGKDRTCDATSRGGSRKRATNLTRNPLASYCKSNQHFSLSTQISLLLPPSPATSSIFSLLAFCSRLRHHYDVQ
jgi:hypothetical protein